MLPVCLQSVLWTQHQLHIGARVVSMACCDAPCSGKSTCNDSSSLALCMICHVDSTLPEYVITGVPPSWMDADVDWLYISFDLPQPAGTWVLTRSHAMTGWSDWPGCNPVQDPHVPHTIWYDTRSYFNMRLKADMSQLNLLHGNDS